MSKKLIALDLDGTTICSNSDLSKELVEVVHNLTENGDEVVIATGRPPLLTKYYAKKLGLYKKLNVTCNGSCICTFDDKMPEGFSIEKVWTFDPKDIIHKVSDELPHTLIAVEKYNPSALWMNRTIDNTEHFGDIKQIEKQVDELSKDPISRLVFFYDKNIHGLFEFVQQNITQDNVRAYLYNERNNQWIDVCRRDKSKATGLAEIAKMLGIDEKDTFVFGDGQNDIPMFKWANTAIGVGDMQEGVEKYVDYVAKSPDENGVVSYLKQILENGKIIGTDENE